MYQSDLFDKYATKVELNVLVTPILYTLEEISFLLLKSRREIVEYLFLLKIVYSDIDCPELLSKVHCND